MNATTIGIIAALIMVPIMYPSIRRKTKENEAKKLAESNSSENKLDLKSDEIVKNHDE